MFHFPHSYGIYFLHCVQSTQVFENDFTGRQTTFPCNAIVGHWEYLKKVLLPA